MAIDQYGITKDGKILLKHGFIAIDSDLPTKENEHNWRRLIRIVEKEGGTLPALIPDGILDGSISSVDCGNDVVVMFRNPGNESGKITRYFIDGGIIYPEIKPLVNHVVRLTPELQLNGGLFPEVIEYLEKHFAHEKSTKNVAGVETHTWDLRGAKRSPIRQHVWGRYQTWVRETVTERFTVDENGMPCGVSLDDLTLRLFLGNDYPIQPDGFDRPMRTAEVSQAQTSLKQTISAMRQSLETKCFSKAGATEQEWRMALKNIASWVLNGKLAD